jgi:hypothetical protein
VQLTIFLPYRNPLAANVKNEKDQEFSFNIEPEKHSETM